MVRKILSLTMLSFFLAIGGLWALRAQDPMPQKPVRPDAAQPQMPAANTTQVDLSGTYAGTFNCEAAGLVGDTTLTINGNEFTTADGKSGRIMASKTAGYTAVALQVNGADATATPMTVSLRAKKSGNKLTLSPASGTTQKCSFVTSKVARGGKTPAATGTEVANPVTVPAQEPSPSPTPSGSPTPMPSPTASPNPSPSEPMPSPTPSPSPSPGYKR